MILFKFFSYLLGYVVIVVTGEAPEKFVNMAASRGVFLWDIMRVGDGAVIMKVRLNTVKSLRHIARRTQNRFRIRSRRGLPFLIARLRKRKALALGAVFSLVILYMLSSFVWFIEVRGNQRLTAEEILGVAREAGLTRGIPKWKVDIPGVEAAIVDKLPVVTWTGVTIKGTKVTVEVAERTLPEVEDRRTSHIVAGKSGLIKEVLVLSGHPVVKEGDTVVPGQILISGIIPSPVEPPEPGEEKKPDDPTKVIPPPRYVHAKGIVRARVWYEGYGEAQIVETGFRPTGRSETRFSMKFQGKEIILSGNQNLPFQHCEEETFVKRLPKWRNLDIPVELVTVKYIEMTGYREERGRAQARRLAEEQALEAVKKQLSGDVKVQERKIEEVLTGHTENLVRVKAVFEVVEDIGVLQYFKP